MISVIQPIQNLIAAARAEHESRLAPKDEPVISISTRTSRASFVYERMRNAVDYKEEHLIRRTAIERILKRMISSGETKNLGENLAHELIHARYLPNKAIPLKKLGQLEQILEKYFLLLGLAPLPEIISPKSLPGWILNLMASEIDEFLLPPYTMHASINTMYEIMNREIHVEEPIEPAERSKQIYLAVSRTLYHNDDNLKFHLFLLYYPDWRQADAALIREVGENLKIIRQRIEADLIHPFKKKLITMMRKHVVYFSILTEIIAKNPDEVAEALHSDDHFSELVTAAGNAHYRSSRNKLRRSIGRSVIYLLLTKFLIALILEIPFEYWLLQRYDVVPLLINLAFPPSLLTIIALSTRLPDDENTKIITRNILRIIQGQTEVIQIPKTKRQKIVLRILFAVFYSALFGVSFGLMIYLLNWLNFTVVSMFVFLLFLSLVSLFAYRIRRSSQELIVTPPPGGLIRSLWSFMTIPILHAGKWMSGKFAQLNIFIFILDFVIEAPFKSFIKITEYWMNYVNEKKKKI